MILDGLRGLVRTATVEIVLVWGCGPIANSISEADWDEAALVSPDLVEKQTHSGRSGYLVRKAIMVRPARAPECRPRIHGSHPLSRNLILSISCHPLLPSAAIWKEAVNIRPTR